MKARKWTQAEDRELAALYAGGCSIEDIGKRFKCSRSAIYRRLEQNNVPSREPAKRSEYYRKPIITDDMHPLARRIYEECQAQRCNLGQLARGIGISREAVGSWAYGVVPSLTNIEAAAKHLGLQLTLIEEAEE